MRASAVATGSAAVSGAASGAAVEIPNLALPRSAVGDESEGGEPDEHHGEANERPGEVREGR